MHPSGFVAGALLVFLVFLEAFETIVSPQRISRRFRLTRAFYRVTWIPWCALARLVPAGKRREAFLSVYGPMSLLALLLLWAVLVVLGFALLHWGGGSRLRTETGASGFLADLYFSGATIFTIAFGDMTPGSSLERVFAVLEAGTGIALLAMVIGYLPSLSQAYSRRETIVSLLDARAGSPPSATELLIRHAGSEGERDLTRLLEEWDRWAAEQLGTHASFPVLGYFRSQHVNQSWIAALTTMLDVCALIIAGLETGPLRPARTGFAMARHAAVDLTSVFHLEPRPVDPDRLPAADLAQLRQHLAVAGILLRETPELEKKLRRLRQMYEPYMNALSHYLRMPLPTWGSPEGARDNWQSMA
jgi:hypothetical protein